MLCPNVIQVKKLEKIALICNVLYGVNITVNEQDVVLNKDYFRDNRIVIFRLIKVKRIL